MDLNGVKILPGYLDRQHQEEIMAAIVDVAKAAPFFHPMTPWGKPMRVRMTSAGRYGWFTDRAGYRYIEKHPDEADWPPVPQCILQIWRDLVSAEQMPECCLINHYDAKARMGLHQDKDEADFSWPVLSISLGDTGVFRIGGLRRDAPTKSVPLTSGDVVIMGGQARLVFHGVDRIKPETSRLCPWGGRVNLTLRVVN